jgi:hypothetical protein
MKTSIAAALPILALAALALAGPGAAQSANTVTPGYWETVNQVVSPFPSKKTEKRCVRPAEVAKFMNGPSNHIYTCTYPTRDIAGGKIRLAGSCKTRDGKPVPLVGEGVFTADTFSMEVLIRPEIGGVTVPVRARTIAKRIGDDCPAEAQKSD